MAESYDTTTTISPMNSNFAALICKDILGTIFVKLSNEDLARSACVCKLWSSVASDRDILVKAFISPWKLKDLIGNPSSGTNFWRDNSLTRFAISHRLLRTDTLPSLALKYSVQVFLNYLICYANTYYSLRPNILYCPPFHFGMFQFNCPLSNSTN